MDTPLQNFTKVRIYTRNAAGLQLTTPLEAPLVDHTHYAEFLLAYSVSKAEFIDTDIEPGKVAGVVSWEPPLSILNFTHFRVFHVEDEAGALPDHRLGAPVQIGSDIVQGTNLLQTPGSLAVGLRDFLLVYTVAGDLDTIPASVPIRDASRLPPEVNITGLTFVDVDEGAGELEGTVEWLPSEDSVTVDGYVVFLAQDSEGGGRLPFAVGVLRTRALDNSCMGMITNYPNAFVTTCHYGANQQLHFIGESIKSVTSPDMCLDAHLAGEGYVYMSKCSDADTQRWHWDGDTIKNVQPPGSVDNTWTQRCLDMETVDADGMQASNSYVHMRSCTTSSSQRWHFQVLEGVQWVGSAQMYSAISVPQGTNQLVVPAGTPRGPNSFMAVYAWNAFGGLQTQGQAVRPLYDLTGSVPMVVVTNVTFDDEDLDVGEVGGKVAWDPPGLGGVAELTGYVVFLAEDAAGTAVTQVGEDVARGKDSLAIPLGTPRGSFDFVLVYATNEHGRAAVPATVRLVDNSEDEPAEVLQGLEFVDSDLGLGFIGGPVTWDEPADVATIHWYEVYLSDGGSLKSLSGRAAVGSNLLLLDCGTPLGSYTEILVYTTNSIGQNLTATSIPIVDRAAPTTEVSSIEFTDTDTRQGLLGGIVTWSPPTPEADRSYLRPPVTAYSFYVATNSTGMGKYWLTEHVAFGTNEAVVPQATPVQSFFTHLVVYTRNDAGESLSGTVVPFEDRYGPTFGVRNLAFTDEEPQTFIIGGPVTWDPPFGEELITHFVVYMAKSATGLERSKFGEDVPFGGVLEVRIPSQEVATQGDFSHVLVYVANGVGEQETPSAVFLTDNTNEAPSIGATSLSFEDSDPKSGFIGGILSWTPPPNAGVFVTQYTAYLADKAVAPTERVKIAEAFVGSSSVSLGASLLGRYSYLLLYTSNRVGEMTAQVGLLGTGANDGDTQLCAGVDPSFSASSNAPLVIGMCAPSQADQQWFFVGQSIRTALFNKCLDVNLTDGNTVYVADCDDQDTQLWQWEADALQNVHVLGNCLDAGVEDVRVRSCASDTPSQRWTFDVVVPAALRITDWSESPPSTLATAVTNQDSDPRGGFIAGKISWTVPAFSADVKAWSIYLATDALGTDRVLLDTVPATSTSLTLAESVAIDGRVYIVVEASSATEGEGTFALIVDSAVVLGVAFADVDGAGGLIEGAIEWAPDALAEATVTHYVVYLATDVPTALDFERIQAGSDIPVGQNSLQILAGTSVGDAAYILVYTKGQGIEASVPALAELRDWALPVGNVTGVEFYDVSVEKGLVSGSITVAYVSVEDELLSYVCYWGESAKHRLGAAVDEVFTLPPMVDNATMLVYVMGATTYPAGATHILVFAQNDDGISETSSAVELVDRFLPTTAPIGIRFFDIDSNRTEIGGLLTVVAAQVLDTITHYVVYYGNGSTSLDNVVSGPIGSVYTTEGRLEVLVPMDTIPPLSATHFLAFSANEVGIMRTGVQLRVHDMVNPRVPPAVDFFDTNGAAGFIAGAVVVGHPVPNSTVYMDTTAIDFYIGREACTTVVFLGTVYLNDTGSDTCAAPFRDEAAIGCFVLEGAPPHNTTTVLAFARNDDGVQPICSESNLTDRAVPVRAPRNVTFSDTDPALGSIGGPIRIEPADVEANITGYVVYFSNGTTKLDGQTAVFSTTKEDVGSEESIIYQGRSVPSAATHLIAFSMNADGESLAFVVSLLVDESGTILLLSAVDVVDSDGTLTPDEVLEVMPEIGEILADFLEVNTGDVDVIDAELIEQRRLQGDGGLMSVGSSFAPLTNSSNSIRITFTVTVMGGENAARVRRSLNELKVIITTQVNATATTPREDLERAINLLLSPNKQSLTVYGGDPTVVSESVVSEMTLTALDTKATLLGASLASTSLYWLFAGILSFIATVMSATVCVGGVVSHSWREQQQLDKALKYRMQDDMWRPDAEGEFQQPDPEPDTSLAFAHISPTGYVDMDDDMWIADGEGVPAQPGDEDEMWIAEEDAMMEAEHTDGMWCPDSEGVPGLEDDIDGDEMWRPEPDSMPHQANDGKFALAPITRTAIGRVGFNSGPGPPSPRRFSQPDFFMGGHKGSPISPPARSWRTSLASDDPWHAEDDEAVPDINDTSKWQALPDEGLEELPSTGKVGLFFPDADFDNRLQDPALFTRTTTALASQGPGGALRGGTKGITAQMFTGACSGEDPCTAQPHCGGNAFANTCQEGGLKPGNPRHRLDSGTASAASSHGEADDPFAEVPIADNQNYIVLEL